jgi:hypothetical protein
MWQFSETPGTGPYRCAECDAVIADANLGVAPVESFVGRSGRPVYRVVSVDGVEVHRCLSPFLMLSESTAAMQAEIAWERISAAREIVAGSAGCSPDEALRVMKDVAAERGNPIDALAAHVIENDALRS